MERSGGWPGRPMKIPAHLGPVAARLACDPVPGPFAAGPISIVTWELIPRVIPSFDSGFSFLWMHKKGLTFDLALERMSKVVSSLSPQNTPSTNMPSAHTICSGDTRAFPSSRLLDISSSLFIELRSDNEYVVVNIFGRGMYAAYLLPAKKYGIRRYCAGG